MSRIPQIGILAAFQTSAVASDAALNSGSASLTVNVNNPPPPQPIAAPNSPSNLIPVSVSSTQATISWSDDSTAEAPARNFSVWRRDIGPAPDSRIADQAWLEIALITAPATSYTDTNLTPNYFYDYKVRACNEGGCSDYSDVLRVTTPLTDGGGGGGACVTDEDCSNDDVCLPEGYCGQPTESTQ